jgi:hypothetical protein
MPHPNRQRWLTRYCAEHPPARVVRFHPNSTMDVATLATLATDDKQETIVVEETIPATLASLRSWLGY